MNPYFPHAVAMALVALTLSLGLNRLMLALGPMLGLMDQPDARRVHVTPVPRAGGLAIWLSFLATFWVGRFFLPAMFDGVLAVRMTAFTAASAVLMVVGFFDDRKGIPALVKLAGQVCAALVYFVVSREAHGQMFGFSMSPVVEAVVFVGWAVLLINAFNLIDGLDGLCGGLVCISLLVLTGIELAAGQFSDTLIIGMMLAAVVGFLRFNFNPARIFLGDAGSMMLGFFLASAATQAGGRRAVVGSILLPLAIAGVPLLDVLLAVWRRSASNLINQWRGGERVGVFSPDTDHLHHRLLKRGIPQRKVALLMQGLATFFAVIAFAPMLLGGRGLMVAVCGLMLLGLFGLRHLAQVELRQMGSLVRLAVKRRRGPGRLRTWYFLYDLLALGASAWTAMMVETNLATRGYDHENVLRFVVAFLACEVVALHVLRVYRRVWSRSVLGEFMLVMLGLLVGGITAGAVFQSVNGDIAWSGFRAALIATSLASWLVLLPRALPELLRELAMDSSHRHLTRRRNSGHQLLVYGAGDLGNLFVKYLKTCTPADFQRFQVSGFLDDSPALKGRTIHGFKILGGLEALGPVCREYSIHGLLIAIHELPEERKEEILREAGRLGLAVYIWSVDLKPRRILAGSDTSFAAAPVHAHPGSATQPLEAGKP